VRTRKGIAQTVHIELLTKKGLGRESVNYTGGGSFTHIPAEPKLDHKREKKGILVPQKSEGIKKAK